MSRKRRPSLKQLMEDHILFVLTSIAISAFLAGIAVVPFIQRTGNLHTMTRHSFEKLEDNMDGLRKQLSEVNTMLSKATSELGTHQSRERAEAEELERIKWEGGIYRVPNEPAVWLIRGGKRHRVPSETHLRRLTGRGSSEAEPNALILKIPVEASSRL
jgi:hypothetical protein